MTTRLGTTTAGTPRPQTADVVTTRLDTELVRRGLARSRRAAAELVAEGRVSLGGALARKPAQLVTATDDVVVRDGAGPQYVSRAAHKLAGALDVLGELAPGHVTITGAHCLDAGASTGGFTQVLLGRGAAHVDAVDVGHGQMSPAVAGEPRVTVHEGVNVRDLDPSTLTAPPDVVVADLSFISLTLVVDRLLDVAAPGADLLLMVKPQFEVGRDRIGATGVVTSPSLRAEAVRTVAARALAAGGELLGVVPSPLPGPAGNHEYFLWLRSPAPHGGGTAAPGSHGALARSAGVPDGVDAVVRSAVADGRAVVLRARHDREAEA